MDTKMKTFQMEVGRLLCRHVREILEIERFMGRKIDFLEGKGWVSRIFTVRGEPADVDAVRERLAHYFLAIGELPKEQEE